MKLKLTSLFLTTSLIFFSFSSNAICKDQKKMNELKLGTHAIAINNNAEGFEDDELSGFMFSYQRNISEYVALRGGLYIDEHDDNSKLEASGIESHILVGNNFTGKGFYGYGGLGFFLKPGNMMIQI